LPPETASHGTSTLIDEAWGLTVLWSRHEPAQVGELLLLPPDEPGVWEFGRGNGSGVGKRLFLTRWTPSGRVARSVVSCPRISRTQLRLSTGNGCLIVGNVGSCSLLHEGRERDRVELVPGDIVFLRNELLLLCVRRPLRLRGSIAELAAAHHEFGQPDDSGLVGESAAMWELRERLWLVSSQPLPVLILGASGTGKELVARALHARSPRRTRSMISRNAATIPEGIADAELFGNVRGYPNGGMPERPGLLGAAHASTLFLDEIAELPLALQVRLLRVLDNGEYHRLGESSARRADVRIIGATNRPSTELRHDVLARFTLQLVLPDLNARREDIPLLIAHLLRGHAARDQSILTRFFPNGDPAAGPRISPKLIETLVTHHYTTNVRELDALLMAAALQSTGSYVESHASISAATLPPQPLLSEQVSWLTTAEAALLGLLRRHRFSPTSCGRDPSYPGNRQTADLHFRHLACKALTTCELDVRRAASLMAGDSDRPLLDKCEARLDTFVANLTARIVSEAPEQLAQAMAEDWKGLADAAIVLVEQLRARRAQLAKPTVPLRSA
jgi:DNA-binding NtrC family response regulator